MRNGMTEIDALLLGSYFLDTRCNILEVKGGCFVYISH